MIRKSKNAYYLLSRKVRYALSVTFVALFVMVSIAPLNRERQQSVLEDQTWMEVIVSKLFSREDGIPLWLVHVGDLGHIHSLYLSMAAAALSVVGIVIPVDAIRVFWFTMVHSHDTGVVDLSRQVKSSVLEFIKNKPAEFKFDPEDSTRLMYSTAIFCASVFTSVYSGTTVLGLMTDIVYQVFGTLYDYGQWLVENLSNHEANEEEVVRVVRLAHASSGAPDVDPNVARGERRRGSDGCMYESRAVKSATSHITWNPLAIEALCKF